MIRAQPTSTLFPYTTLFRSFHNGVLAQDNYELEGGTVHKVEPKYAAHPDKAPIALQEHGHPVRYRNIWIRPLEDRKSTRLNSSHRCISYAVFCLKKKTR